MPETDTPGRRRRHGTTAAKASGHRAKRRKTKRDPTGDPPTRTVTNEALSSHFIERVDRFDSYDEIVAFMHEDGYTHAAVRQIAIDVANRITLDPSEHEMPEDDAAAADAALSNVVRAVVCDVMLFGGAILYRTPGHGLVRVDPRDVDVYVTRCRAGGADNDIVVPAQTHSKADNDKNIAMARAIGVNPADSPHLFAETPEGNDERPVLSGYTYFETLPGGRTGLRALMKGFAQLQATRAQYSAAAATSGAPAVFIERPAPVPDLRGAGRVAVEVQHGSAPLPERPVGTFSAGTPLDTNEIKRPKLIEASSSTPGVAHVFELKDGTRARMLDRQFPSSAGLIAAQTHHARMVCETFPGTSLEHITNHDGKAPLISNKNSISMLASAANQHLRAITEMVRVGLTRAEKGLVSFVTRMTLTTLAPLLQAGRISMEHQAPLLAAVLRVPEDHFVAVDTGDGEGHPLRVTHDAAVLDG